VAADCVALFRRELDQASELVQGTDAVADLPVPVAPLLYRHAAVEATQEGEAALADDEALDGPAGGLLGKG
jgi:hypothetical protein